MTFHSSWFLTFPCFSIILLARVWGQFSSNSQVYSETNEIIAYGDKIFETIANYRHEDGNIIEIWKRIEDNSKIRELINRIPTNILEKYSCKEESGLDNVKSMFQYIDDKFNKFEHYFLHEKNDSLLDEFVANITIHHDLGLIGGKMYVGMTWYVINDPFSYHEIFKYVVDRHNPMVESNCNNVQSLNRYIYDLYNKMLYGFIKIYSIIIYSYTHLLTKMNNQDVNIATSQESAIKENLESGLKNAVDSYETNIRIITQNALQAIGHSSRNIFSRDPSIHMKGTTYHSLDYFLQSYVSAQKYLSRDGICRPTCSQHNDTVHYNHTDGKLFPINSICTGRIRACTETAAEKICLAPLDSTRRYESLSNIPANGKGLKNWGHAPKNCTIFLATDSWFSHCKLCSCICDLIDSPKSIRYIDLGPRRSDFSAAFVITGIQFRIINRVLYLQVQNGELKDGRIDPGSVYWTDIYDTDRNYENDSDLFKLDFDNRLLDLADLTLPSNYAITMVKFTVIDGIIGLQIGGHPMIDGELNVSVSTILSNQSVGGLRPVFHSDGMNIPIGETIKNIKLSEPNKFLLKFETSDWEKDAGQNVVPYIDLQDIVTDPPAPLTGIGIHVRYGDDSGGFLAPKLISTDNAEKLEYSTVLQHTRTMISSWFLHDEELKLKEEKPPRNRSAGDSFIRLG